MEMKETMKETNYGRIIKEKGEVEVEELSYKEEEN